MSSGRHAVVVVAVACAFGACGHDPTIMLDDDPPTGDAVDLDALFAPATEAEIDAVLADWASRTITGDSIRIERDTLIQVGPSFLRLRVVSHVVGGARHYGAVLGANGPPGQTPIVVYAHPGDEGLAVEEVLAFLGFVGDVAADFVWVLPSFRGETLTFSGAGWHSDGAPSPWDGDVDDALALLDVALEVEPAADAGSVGVLGFSRGAGVGLLMGVRDPRVDRIVDFFGPTDFFGPFVRDVVAEALAGELRALPGVAFMDATFLQPLARGELTVAEVRPELVRRSAVLFADRLPDVQIHHGAADLLVDVSQAQSLTAAMQSIGRVAPGFQSYVYPGAGHDPLSMPASLGRAVAFLSALLPEAAPAPTGTGIASAAGASAAGAWTGSPPRTPTSAVWSASAPGAPALHPRPIPIR